MARRYSRSGLKLLQADMMRVLNPAFLAIEDEQDPAANAAALAAFDDANLSTGYVKPLQSVRDLVSLDRESSASVDNITVFATKSGVGRWIRLVVRHPHWSSQAAWEIDPVAGNDENDGTPGHPLKTWVEFTRRVRVINVGMTVTIPGSLSEPLRGTFETGSSTAWLLVTGQPTVLAYATATTFADPVSATNTRGSVTATDLTVATTGAAGDFTNYVGKIMRAAATDGPNHWPILRASSASVAEGGFWAQDLNNTKPTNGTRVDVLDLVTAPTVDIVTNGLPVSVRYFRFTDTTTAGAPCVNPLRMQQPSRFLTGPVLLSTFTACDFTNSVHGYQTWFIGCILSPAASAMTVLPAGGACIFLGGGSLRSLHLFNPGIVQFQGFIIQGGKLTVGAQHTSVSTPGTLAAAGAFTGSAPLGVFDSAGDAVLVTGGASLGINNLFGSGSAGYGVRVQSGGSMRVTGSPTITGTLGDLQLDGAATAIPQLTAGAAVPAASALTTWAQWAAAPFNRYVFSYKTGSRILGA